MPMLVTALETLRLIIRDARASDAEAFHAYMQREQYWRDLPIDPPTPASIASMVDTCRLDQAKEPRTDYLMAATDKASGTIIGEAILHVRSIRWRQGEIGWGVSPDYIGRGLGTEIGLAMIRFAFDDLDLHRVFAQCRVENQASRRIMAKLGMREEGILRENVFARGSWWSSAQYSILATERTSRNS
jgi:[ribosomal protein S5]-alanine N-acetyltransferase